MYLAESMRGKGAGKLLLEHAIKRARELGFSLMWLETAEVLKEAVNLYQKYGFAPYEADHQSCRCDFALAKKLD